MFLKKIGHISALLVGLAILILACSSPDAQKTKHVVLIGVDGMSPDGIRNADTPVMDELMINGVHSFTARAVLPSSSGANWASLLNGAGPEQHGVISNSWRTDNFILPATVVSDENKFPSVFRVIRDQMPEAVTGSIMHWAPIKNFIELSTIDYTAEPSTEDESARLTAAFILENKPAFTFMHLDHVDHAGHHDGHGTPIYYQSVEKADSLIGIVVQAVKDAGIFDDTIIMITADHGGLGKGHGGETLEEMNIPWIISGQEVKANYVENTPINTYDTPATILYALGLEVPYEWIGRPVKSAFVGNPAPKLMYSLNGIALKPVILPAAEGYTPPGGLFIGENGELQITTSTPNAEIRYTLDGTLPTSDSPIYTAPVEITKTTVVKAQVYANGQALSQVSSGYFRVLKNASGHGVNYTTYIQDELTAVPDVATLKPTGTGTTLEIDLVDVELPRPDNVVAVFEGYLDIQQAGDYRFYLASDDGSNLYIDGNKVVDNDGDHGVIERDGSTKLDAGKHKIQVDYINAGGGGWLGVYYEGPGVPKQLIPANKLYLKN